ncbi:type III-A CRISPR-associated protein Csm2 [Caldiplasma sukawensis]
MRDERNYKRESVSTTNVEDERKIFDYIRQEKDIDYKSKYQIFGIEGLIKRTYCRDEANDSTMNQLRRFYDQIVSIEERASKGEDSINDLIRLVPIVRYANARKLVDNKFLNLIDKAVQIITEQNGDNAIKSLHSFKNVMEAIIAYSKKVK